MNKQKSFVILSPDLASRLKCNALKGLDRITLKLEVLIECRLLEGRHQDPRLIENSAL